MDIETPCTKVCRIVPDSGLCAGCRRNIDEIMRWREMTPAERRAVMAALPGRSPGR